jgi:hypothetical protein
LGRTLGALKSKITYQDYKMNRTEALILIAKFSLEEFIEKIDHLKLSEKRANQFFEVINGTKCIDQLYKFDIEEYALKSIFPCFYRELQTTNHLYSTSEIYEFDPAKNGQNIVKHGLSFGEVVSYSTKFGTLSISCPDEKDHQRIIIFSDLILSIYKLELPLSEGNGENYTLSIAKQLDGKIRFISSRFLSSKKQKYTETVKQAIRSVKFPDEASKESFVVRCIEIIERYLISKNDTPAPNESLKRTLANARAD